MGYLTPVVDSIAPAYLDRPGRPRIAYRHAPGSGPTIIFLPGYMSDMAGSKAMALFAWATAEGRASLLLDYAGCGLSEGLFADQTLLDWRRDILDLIDAKIDGPVLLVGSSMGGWLMLLAALELVRRDGQSRVAGLVGIAAAPDFTDWGFAPEEKAIILAEGALVQDTPYGDQPYVTTRGFFQSGEANRLLDDSIALDCPARLLHGQEDGDVPPQVSLRLAAALASDDVQITLVKGGDHRLSREGDIALLIDTVECLATPI